MIAQALPAATGGAATIGEQGPSHTNSAAIAAILQRMASAQRDLVRSVVSGRLPRRVAATGGGARSPVWLRFMAGTLGVRVVAPAGPELACLGAAVFAAVAAGIHRDCNAAARAMVQPGRHIEPGGS